MFLNKPRLLVVAGPNGSGKSSIVSTLKIGNAYAENLINPDNYARGVKDIQDIEARYIFALEMCERIRETLLQNEASFGFETVGSMKDKIEFIKRAVEKGYSVDLLYVTLNSPELCLKRIAKRVSEGGHDVNPEKVVARYERSMNNLHHFIKLADRADIYDNSGDMPLKVFTKKNGKYTLHVNPEKYSWMKKYIISYFEDVKESY